MKKVFSGHASLSHAWANQTHPIGKANSMFFDGPVIYSWGYHYEIARFIDAPNGEKVCFINSNGYSNSTGKHTNHVANAIPKNITKFFVPFVIDGGYWHKSQTVKIDQLPSIINKIMLNIDSLIEKQLNARSKFYYFNSIYSFYNQVLNICELFNIEKPVLPVNWFEAETKANFLRNTEQDRQKAKEQKELKKSIELLEKWQKHEFNGQLYNIPVHLRISKDGQLIETTKGAKVEFSKAVELYNRLKRNENVNGYKIDGFTVLENNSEAVKIGCHVINWPIINKFFNHEN
jgi:hypothetical protein